MATTAQAMRNMRAMQRAMLPDPDGVRTIAGAKALYVRGEISVEEFERRVGVFLSGRPIVVLQPGEQVIVPSRDPRP